MQRSDADDLCELGRAVAIAALRSFGYTGNEDEFLESHVVFAVKVKDEFIELCAERGLRVVVDGSIDP